MGQNLFSSEKLRLSQVDFKKICLNSAGPKANTQKAHPPPDLV